MVDRLIDIIGREAALFERFLLLLERQQRALVANDQEELTRVTDLQRETLAESRRLHEEREGVLADIRRTNAIEGDLTVTRLVAMVDADRADRLAALRGTILDLNERILRLRNQNVLLLNRSREYIRRTMELLSRIASPRAETYAPAGAAGAEARTVALDRRV
ncbi:MAG TPA: flagellar export chaperone FlgN [candidate division Zixibacteria bacterium]|nr:flagellar export chaperone FlgN [candidate division Zixibacteria bacterium]MDD4917158.1 flagellar export chaperone FlgN [candidate division Zixibacteria bacterium]MDM7973257.1 flagellar export chaperone FlgN [candidate division Zixibacteria bacterium]HOD65426.1 flagellar export chaperone FlgN [candidate division Zixibacteria bacterium]HOZ06767.1 flagellar export chaperone FlgN [candidate division Zixibacteria bacterium]